MVLEKFEKKQNRLGYKKTWFIVLEKDDPHACFKCDKAFEENKFIRMEWTRDKELTNHFFCFDCSEGNDIPGRLGLVVKIEPKEEIKNDT